MKLGIRRMKMMRMRATAPMGAYCRIIALMLIFLAARRHFSDSDRSEVDKWDMPSGGRRWLVNGDPQKRGQQTARTV